MFVSVVTSHQEQDKKYILLDEQMNKLIEDSGCYLFTMLCGQQEETELGKRWAAVNGAPVRYLKASSSADLLGQLIKKSDYIIFILDGTAAINNAFMKYKSLGKHGSVIRLK